MNGITIDLSEGEGASILERLTGKMNRVAEEVPQRGQKEAQAMELQQTYENFARGCPYKPGDMVTPRASSYLKLAGEPHVVLEVFETPYRNWTPDEVGSPAHGALYDFRVACVSSSNTSICGYAGESWCYEPWEG